ncbi:hypothetical protein N474_11810 [Pseudoalteromonas luteoviolacea CPMOR-2]|nr:hypothetical protein N474_11810 [Pseudoalteromonas luteoviolacea CPMOR-2]
MNESLLSIFKYPLAAMDIRLSIGGRLLQVKVTNTTSLLRCLEKFLKIKRPPGNGGLQHIMGNHERDKCENNFIVTTQ